MLRLCAGLRGAWFSGQRAFSTTAAAAQQHVIAIRREDNSVWERRAPFSPSHVRELIARHGVKVIVQPSNRRAYAMQVRLSCTVTAAHFTVSELMSFRTFTCIYFFIFTVPFNG